MLLSEFKHTPPFWHGFFEQGSHGVAQGAAVVVTVWQGALIFNSCLNFNFQNIYIVNYFESDFDNLFP